MNRRKVDEIRNAKERCFFIRAFVADKLFADVEKRENLYKVLIWSIFMLIKTCLKQNFDF